MRRIIRERHQAVRNGNDFVRMISIYERVGKHAAVAFSADGTAVSVIIARRCSDKGDINCRFSGLNCTDAAAVGTHDGKAF